jgi:transposase
VEKNLRRRVRRVRVDRLAAALAAFAAHADPDGTKVLILTVGRAGWHTAKRLTVPANVRLHFLPACTPELQPVEPFWALVREGVANRTFDRLGDLRRVVGRRCRKLAADPGTVSGAVGFRWAANLETEPINAIRYESAERRAWAIIPP